MVALDDTNGCNTVLVPELRLTFTLIVDSSKLLTGLRPEVVDKIVIV